jgi:shikimate kinase
MNIYFSGMIGSGKTTIGAAVAERLELPVLDLDEEMDDALGYSFHHLVQEQGWLPFRELEYAICKRFATMSGVVCCLGGGTVRYEWNVDLLRPSGVTVYLEAAPETLIERVRAADRPRVNAGTTLEEDVHRIWSEHRQKYLDAADIVFRSDEAPVHESADRLVQLLRAEPRLAELLAARE